MLSVELFQANDSLVCVLETTTRLAGVVGGIVSLSSALLVTVRYADGSERLPSASIARIENDEVVPGARLDNVKLVVGMAVTNVS